MEIPQALICSITMELMEDPVLLSGDGHTYERKAIAEWLSRKNTSPMTNELLESNKLVPNRAIKTQVSDWKEKQAALQEAKQLQRPPPIAALAPAPKHATCPRGPSVTLTAAHAATAAAPVPVAAQPAAAVDSGTKSTLERLATAWGVAEPVHERVPAPASAASAATTAKIPKPVSAKGHAPHLLPPPGIHPPGLSAPPTAPNYPMTTATTTAAARAASEPIPELPLRQRIFDEADSAYCNALSTLVEEANGDISVVSWSNPARDKDTALHVAARGRGKLQAVSLQAVKTLTGPLGAQGNYIDANKINKSGNTALMEAVVAKNMTVVKELMLVTDLDKVNKDGETFASLLIKAGHRGNMWTIAARPDQGSMTWPSPLEYACQNMDMRLVQRLVHTGAELNREHDWQLTATTNFRGTPNPNPNPNPIPNPNPNLSPNPNPNRPPTSQARRFCGPVSGATRILCGCCSRARRLSPTRQTHRDRLRSHVRAPRAAPATPSAHRRSLTTVTST